MTVIVARHGQTRARALYCHGVPWLGVEQPIELRLQLDDAHATAHSWQWIADPRRPPRRRRTVEKVALRTCTIQSLPRMRHTALAADDNEQIFLKIPAKATLP